VYAPSCNKEETFHASTDKSASLVMAGTNNLVHNLSSEHGSTSSSGIDSNDNRRWLTVGDVTFRCNETGR